MNGFAEPLLIDTLAQLPIVGRFALFIALGIAAGWLIDIVVRRVPVAVERAWQEEMQAAYEAGFGGDDDMAHAKHAARVDQPAQAAPAADHAGSGSVDDDAAHTAQAAHLSRTAHTTDYPGRPSGTLLAGRHAEPLPHGEADATHHRPRYERDTVLSTTPSAAATAPAGPMFSDMPAPHASRPARRALVVTLAAAVAAAVTWRYGPTWQSLGALGLAWTLLALAFIDFDTQLLPDILTLPLLWAGLLVNLGHWFAALPTAVIGAAAGYVSLWTLYWLHRLWRGQEGMGFGDFKLFAALGAWFGWTALLQILLIACVLAVIVAGGAWLAGRLQRQEPFPFGPFLAIAGLVTLFGGNSLLYWTGGTP